MVARGGPIREANQDGERNESARRVAPKVRVNRTEHGESRIWVLRECFSERHTRIFSE